MRLEDVAMTREERLRKALKDLLGVAPSGGDFRLLLMTSNATPDNSPELYAQADALDAARDNARKVLGEYPEAP